jgi:mono/diheme cytochrome c family protein
MRMRLGIAAIVAAFLSVCWATTGTAPVMADEPKKDDEKKVPTFKNDVAPLLTSACGNCHTGARKKGGVDLTSYDTIMKTVKANDPDKSKLVMAVSGKGAKLMPPKKGLSDAQIDTLKAWINAGAKNE